MRDLRFHCARYPADERQQHRVRVELTHAPPHSYDIVIGPGVLARHGAALLEPYIPRLRRIFVLADVNALRHCMPVLEENLTQSGITPIIIPLPHGEKAKSLECAGQLIDILLEKRIERTDTLAALGGGVAGDLTGFIAAMTLRGINFVQIPTSLLAQVDAAIGGKTAVNAFAGKNLIGAFWQPQLVLADTDTLRSLPKRQFLAGYAEILKYGAIGDASFFDWLETKGHDLLEGNQDSLRLAIAHSCAMKSGFVAQDSTEKNTRALLNFGHSFGHALEKACQYDDTLLHGEAVSIGMVMASAFSAECGLCPPQCAERIQKHLADCQLPTHPSELMPAVPSADRMLYLMDSDKKKRDGVVALVLLRAIGEAFLCSDYDQNALKGFLTRFLETPNPPPR